MATDSTCANPLAGRDVEVFEQAQRAERHGDELRRSLIVKEHGKLPYPEGTACAEVLMAGERGGTLAKKVFQGVFTAASYWILMGVLRLWRDTTQDARTLYIRTCDTLMRKLFLRDE